MKITKTMSMRAAVWMCAAGLAVGSLMAQDATAPQQQGQMQRPPPGGRRGGGPEQRLERMQKDLGLTADQTAQVKAILEGERAKMEAMRADTSTTPEQNRPKMMAIREESTTKIKAILTEDQKAKYAAMEERMKERGQGRGPGGGGPGGGGPPQQGPPQ